MATLKSLRARPSLEYLKKLAKERLKKLRQRDPVVKLAVAQLAIAREFGFPSWRKLKAHVDELRTKMDSVKADENQISEFADAVRQKNHAAMARTLRQIPALANAALADGQTMLHLAAETNDTRSVCILLDTAANAQAKWHGHTPLSWAATVGASGSAKTLIQRGVEPDLFCAAGFGDLKRVKKFFDDNGRLLPNASQTGSSRCDADGKWLPCPPTKAPEIIADALYIAARQGHAKVAKFLLAHNPDLHFRAYMRGTLLHWAYFGANPKIIQMLIAAGIDTSDRDNFFKCTPRGFGIHVATDWGILDLVRRQLKTDPDLANIFDGGTTPLHRAAAKNHAAIAKCLLRAGADASVRDAEGRTAVEVAREKGHLGSFYGSMLKHP